MKKSSLGFFLAVLVFAALTAGPATAQNASDVPAPAVPEQVAIPNHPLPGLTDTYGTTATSFYMIPGSAFFPFSNTGYNSDNFGRGPRWTTSGGVDMNARINLPGGAKVVYMELDYYDNSTTGRVFASLTTCPWTGSGCTYHPSVNPSCQNGFICSTIAGASTSIGLVSVDLTSDNLVVDNFNNQFTALAEPTTQDGLTKVAGVIIGYKLQVSPAPGVASFTDVPTSYWAFQYIEALKASGITQGVTPTTFEPESNVTRAQMAVFLAKALGLQFP